MGDEEWVGVEEWSAGGTTAIWDALLVYGCEKGECLVCRDNCLMLHGRTFLLNYMTTGKVASATAFCLPVGCAVDHMSVAEAKYS